MNSSNAPDTYRGNQPRDTPGLDAWLALGVPEPTLEPDLAIIDPHHHLWHFPDQNRRYLLPDFLADLDSGHKIVATVFVEAASMWRSSGPAEMRPVGEVEFAAGNAAVADSGIYGDRRFAAGIVSHADLALGDAVGRVLDAEITASVGRLRGVRHQTAYDSGVIGRYIRHPVPEHLLTSTPFISGFRQLAQRGLSFDAWLFHPQIPDLTALAAQFPDTPIVLNHTGGVLGVENWRADRVEVLRAWRQSMSELARHENVTVKVGGMGMPVFGFGFEQRARPPDSADLAAAWTPFIETCVEVFGPGRCMFESNFPVDKQSCSYQSLWNAFKRATVSFGADERAALFHDTAARVYRLGAGT